jgi:hypothetical protein
MKSPINLVIERVALSPMSIVELSGQKRFAQLPLQGFI